MSIQYIQMQPDMANVWHYSAILMRREVYPINTISIIVTNSNEK